MAKANWLPSLAPQVFTEIAAATSEEKQFNHHDADRAKHLTDAITALMRNKSLNPLSCERRPPKENKNRKNYFAIGRVIVVVGTHALGKHLAYNAGKHAWPHAP